MRLIARRIAAATVVLAAVLLLAVAQAGETIILRGGTYRELIKPRSDNITIRAAKGESVVVSGADLVGPWTRQADRWTAPLSGKPAKLLLDGVRYANTLGEPVARPK